MNSDKLSKYMIIFLKELQKFDYDLSVNDPVWKVLFKDLYSKWRCIHVVLYQESFYITDIEGESGVLEVKSSESINMIVSRFQSHPKPVYEDEYMLGVWENLISSAHKWLRYVKKDWIRANKQVQNEYPLNYRYGIVPNCLARESLPNIYRLDNDLGKKRTRILIRLIEDGFFDKDENTTVSSMTADRYFEYCKIAYVAGARKTDNVDKSLTGRELYKRFADGRHEGLLDISPDSEQEFADWIDGKHPKKSTGGHPWEIKRGGNTTHIDLAVSRPSSGKERFIVQLRGESLGRMLETMKMLLAIYDAGLPITIANPESVRSRFLGQDNIGIIPKYDNLHRANQHFHPTENVFDVIHYSDLGRNKRRLAPFIKWEVLPILKPNKLYQSGIIS